MFGQKSRVQKLLKAQGPTAMRAVGEPAAICVGKASRLGCILRAVSVSDICALVKESETQNLVTE